jgi:uncharacterized protein
MTITPPQPLPRPVRWLLMGLAVASLVLAVIGAFLPIMPTVPFVILAAWAATRSSPRLARWLESHPQMGPYIRDWRAGGAVNRRAKWFATVTMSMGAVSLAVFVRPWWVPVSAITMMVGIGTWLWLRPERPRT